MWHKLREQRARADKAELELKEYREDMQRNREKRSFEESIPLYIECVEVAFLKIRRSHPEQPNTIPLARLASAVDMEKGTLRKVLMIMQDRKIVTIKPAAFERGDEDVRFLI